ncbi:accessory gene regulator ArgB-like protein [Clostridium oryzae]|uniref:Accessory protein regulator protein B n=1 Tax=Clostridium oryzae TaxID=1450648 RepID=A0A1V4IPV6_9CLOT|nr:accessory gene regulator B family protein [Clostridium oryzae]OPJ61956.1 accessory protein regulator protein B [Clostridium oryzae]
MSITERIAISFGKKTKDYLNINDDREEIIVYGAISLLQTIFSILCVVAMGAMLGVLYETLLFSIAGALLRKYSGGVHASSSSRCIIIGTFVSVMFGIFINKIQVLNIHYVLILCILSMIFALITVLKNAPVDSINKQIDSLVMRKKFKKLSVIIVILFSIVIFTAGLLYSIDNNSYYVKTAECFALGSFWQAVTLTRAGTIAFNKVDFVLKYIMERK